MVDQRNYLADFDMCALSAMIQEADLNTEAVIDTTYMVDKGDILGLEPRREDNRDALTGYEEPDVMYDLGALSGAVLNFNRAQAQHFALLLSYAYGVSTPSAWGTGFKHLIQPTDSMFLPTMTGAMRYGKTIFKRRFTSLLVESVVSTFAKDSWAKVVGTLRGTGKYTDNMTKEVVSGFYDDTSLTLAASGVQGATAALRLQNVHQIRVEVPATGEWKEVAYTVVSAASPAVITIAAPGGAHSACDYEILYSPTAVAWETFPARIDETPMRVSDLVVKIGGKYNAGAVDGGRTLASEIESISHTITNNAVVEFRVGGTGSYANYILRKGRIQTIKLDRQMRDFILQQRMKDLEYWAIQMKATGAEFETGKNFYVDMIFPRCQILNAPISVNDKVLAEAGDLVVMHDATAGFSSRIEVANQVAKYAALT